MKKLYLLLILLAFAAIAQAQHIAVKDFYYAENDLTARTHGTSVEDQNGNLCALIKVRTTEKGMWTFDVGMLGVTKTEMQNEKHSAEIWVYVPFSVTRITIQHDKLGIVDRWPFPCSIEKGCTYVMELMTGKVITIVEEEARMQCLAFQITPPNAVLTVNGELWEVEADGTIMKSVDFGTYTYRVQAQGYQSEIGMAKVDDPDKPRVVTVSLNPVLTEVPSSNQQSSYASPNNMLAGVFSVSPTEKVHFSKGNLQYQASTNTWRFAEHQWDYIGDANLKIPQVYNDWLDLFGWGTGDDPTKTSTRSRDYSNFTDWGSNLDGGWRTLTEDEWKYVFDERNTNSGIRYVKATVIGVKGIILLPDDWNSSTYELSKVNRGGASFSSNSISVSAWNSSFAPSGAVFLPACGGRFTDASSPCFGERGFYWSASSSGNGKARRVIFVSYESAWNQSVEPSYGHAVRLVCPVEK